ncbi:MAG: hypothetical protein RL095_2717 [Verrucomicrobiota bacterium]|jgi:hypothetical protein
MSDSDKPKIKLRTSANIPPASVGKPSRTSRRAPARTDADEELDEMEAQPVRSKAPLIIGSLILVAGLGVGGYFAFKPKPDPGYIETQAERAELAEIDELVKNGGTTTTQENGSILREAAARFVAAHPQHPRVLDTKDVPALVPECDEILAQSTRSRLSVELAQAWKLEDDVAEQQAALKANQEKLESDRRNGIDTQNTKMQEKFAAVKAKTAEMDAARPEIRWGIINECVDVSRYTPDKKVDTNKYEFQAAINRLEPYKAFEAMTLNIMDYSTPPAPIPEKTEKAGYELRDWGLNMTSIATRAKNTFESVANRGQIFRDRPMTFDGRLGKIRTLSQETVVVAIREMGNLVDDWNEFTRPLSDIPPDELWPLVKDTPKRDKNLSDAQLAFDFACLLYTFKEFPDAKKYLAQSEADETLKKLLADEIAAVEPRYNRQELTRGLELGNALFKDGKRNDCLRRIGRYYKRFQETAEWGEFQGQYDTLKSEAEKLNRDE